MESPAGMVIIKVGLYVNLQQSTLSQSTKTTTKPIPAGKSLQKSDVVDRCLVSEMKGAKDKPDLIQWHGDLLRNLATVMKIKIDFSLLPRCI
jgi:hypothetical protein